MDAVMFWISCISFPKNIIVNSRVKEFKEDGNVIDQNVPLQLEEIVQLQNDRD